MSSLFHALPAGWRHLLVAAVVVIVAGGPAAGAKPKGDPMSYSEARDFLATHTNVLELIGSKGARVAICPSWQGRVMTSTCGGIDGPSFGFLCTKFIEGGKLNPHFNNYGGEDRVWLSPEGGPFSLWFKPGDAQKLEDWYTPPAFNEGVWEVTSGERDPFYRMEKRMRLRNTAATEFDLKVTRTVRLIRREEFGKLFGEAAGKLVAGEAVKMVGYETGNTITNEGPALERKTGLISIWILGMLNASPKTVVLVPYKPGSEKELGPVVQSDYFGAIPPARLKVLPEAILFMADAKCRSKIGTSQKRARNVLGSIDFAGNVLTVVQFSMPDDPTKVPYMNNMWGVPQPEPYQGDVANAYNDGPSAPGKEQMGNFYEIESLSPAAELAKGKSLTHHHRTIHIQADPATLEKLAKQVLGVDLEKVKKEMIGK
jgi:hypothetical protein